jgi:CRISPR-associated protein Csd1
MILQSLVNYYDRLASQSGVLPPYGWSWEKISYCLVLNADGSINHIEDLRIPTETKKKITYTQRLLMVPMFPEVRTVNIEANYLWDNSGYVFGLLKPPKEKDEKKLVEKLAKQKNDLEKKYQDFWEKVYSFDSANSKALIAIQKFQLFWNKNEQNCPKLNTEEILDTNFVFRLVTENKFIHECEEFKTQWIEKLAEYRNGLSKGQCLIQGDSANIADLHLKIKGVDNAHPTGANIVSFNKDAFTSYGLENGKNAPIGTDAAFKYVAVLNHILREGDNNKQRLKIGDAITVFWAEASESSVANMAECFMSEAINPTDAQQTASLASLLQQVSQGIPLKELRPDLDPGTKFYILGLSPSDARLSVRFWYATTLNELTRRVAQHYHDLHLEPQHGNGLPQIKKLTYATAPVYTKKDKQEIDFDRISPQLAGNLARAIFTGQAYPQSLLSQLLIRMRSDGVINGIIGFNRISLCKAVINRQIRLNQSTNTKELSMSLDVEEENVAYRMGRLFAVLESIQKQALGNDINATIRDRYWGSASATPALVFPMLIRNANNHLAKIRKDDLAKKHLAAFFDWQIRDIEHGMPTSWPRNLNLQDQGRFAIGYYHQRYTPKIKDKTGKEIENLVAVHDDEDQTPSLATED